MCPVLSFLPRKKTFYDQDFPEETALPPGPDFDLKKGTSVPIRVQIRSKSGQDQVLRKGFGGVWAGGVGPAGIAL